VAKVLGITVNTASSHIKNIYRKCHISSRAEAALEAKRLGLV
jgi:DNA-binding CsgD family transcriptional regulator